MNDPTSLTEPLALWQAFDRNEAGQDFAVDDIHGHFPALERLLAKAGFNKRHDRLFSVGDLIDRGPASTSFTDYLQRPWFHAIRGNHEQMMIESATDPGMLETWEANGGSWATEHMGLAAIDRMRAAADRLPLAIEVMTRRGRIGLVHAHLPFPTWGAFRQALQAISAVHFDPQPVEGERRASPYFPINASVCLWEAMYSRATAYEMLKRARYSPETADALRIPDLDALVIGHTSLFGGASLSVANLHLIDTGAGHPRQGAKLTLLNLETFDTISEPTVSAEDVS